MTQSIIKKKTIEQCYWIDICTNVTHQQKYCAINAISDHINITNPCNDIILTSI